VIRSSDMPSAKMLLIRIVAHVVERQHRDRGAIRERQRRGLAVRHRGRLPDKPVAASVQRLDIVRLAGIIPQGFSKLLDAGDECGRRRPWFRATRRRTALPW